jgi:hypothetical protein
MSDTNGLAQPLAIPGLAHNTHVSSLRFRLRIEPRVQSSARCYAAFREVFSSTKRNVMVCALSNLWDEATKAKYLSLYLIKKVKNNEGYIRAMQLCRMASGIVILDIMTIY